MQPRQDKSLVLLQTPGIDPNLEEFSPIPRSAECLRHFILSTEYWLSPRGRLRWWFKINLCLWAWLLIPAIFLMPVVSVILHELDASLSVLVSIVLKLILLSVLISVAMLVIKHFPSSSSRSSGRRK